MYWAIVTVTTVGYGDILNDLAAPFTITAWVYRRGDGVGPIFCSDEMTSRYQGLWLQLGPDNDVHAGYADNTANTVPGRRSKYSEQKVPAGIWTHVAGVVDHGHASLGAFADSFDDGESILARELFAREAPEHRLGEVRLFRKGSTQVAAEVLSGDAADQVLRAKARNRQQRDDCKQQLGEDPPGHAGASKR